MNVLLWVLQIVLALYFGSVGVMHFIVPPGLPAPMSWMYELSPGLHWFSGAAEILAALGLVLPGLTKIRPQLTVLAAAGLVLLMAGAAVWHITQGQTAMLLTNAVLAAVSGFVAYGRWKLRPL
jgi:putative oxidoreductase